MRIAGIVVSLVSSGYLACGGSPPPVPASSTPAATPVAPASDTATAAQPKSAGVDGAALEKLTLEEAKSGTCDAEHKAAFEKLLDVIEANIRAAKDEGEPLKIESFTKRVLALSDAAKGIQLTLSGKGTQVHVIALAPKEVSMDVLSGKAAATTMRSTYKADATHGASTISLPKLGGDVPLESDSRQIEMKPGAQLDVRMRGQGCAGVVVFSKS
ncbi:MAG TPA: hypothetical protein VM580_32655 [Labilithrix sp.]|jgi:hypothetical protein|nr:hypothetical protein [Labilithrix sp.]